MTLNIGKLALASDAMLAPLSEVSDLGFRLLCKHHGAALTSNEMVSASAIARGNKSTLNQIDVVDDERPCAIQLFGQNTENLVKAAKFCESRCSMIDLNFGCPSHNIVRQGAGAALLQRPNKIKEIVEAVSNAVQLPVSCKLRLGIRRSKINVVKIAQICESAGAKMVIIHARTLMQGYTGKAEWKWIKTAKENVNIPVIGNGDVRNVEDYASIKLQTGCDGVMIGRAALYNPFIFRQIIEFNESGNYRKYSLAQQNQDILLYNSLIEKYKLHPSWLRAMKMNKPMAEWKE